MLSLPSLDYFCSSPECAVKDAVQICAGGEFEALRPEGSVRQIGSAPFPFTLLFLVYLALRGSSRGQRATWGADKRRADLQVRSRDQTLQPAQEERQLTAACC